MDDNLRHAVARSWSDDPERIARWLNAGARDMIQAAIDASSVMHTVVDLEVLPNKSVCAASDILAVGNAAKHVVDVPVRAVIALTGARADTLSVGTWRSLFDSIHAVGWKMEHLAYFDRRIAGAKFMAPGATAELTMAATGAMAYVTNGMHRMIAGACWLGARDGGQARLRDVEVSFSSVHPLACAKIVELHAQGYAVALAKHETHTRETPHFQIRASKEAVIRTFTVCGFSLAENVPARRRIFLRPEPESCLVDDWETLHPRVMEALGDDRWLPENLLVRYEGSGSR